MMETLRTAANSLVIKIIFGVIILSFILTGVGGYLGSGGQDYAVKVNGQEISIPSFEQAVQSERMRLQQQLGDQFSILAGNEEYMKQMRNQVLVRMVDDVLLDQYAEKLGLVVSDQMIKDNIVSFPYFQTDGKFDNDKFKALVAQMGLTPDSYAQYIRQQLVNQQLIQGYMATDFVLPAESQALAALTLQSRDIRLATIDVQSLVASQKVTDAELQDYYQKNSSHFITPEQVKVSYIELDAARFAEQVKVTDEEVAAYYQQNKDSYTQPEQRRYSIIQLDSEKEAQQVAAQLKGGADFVALAKEKSSDIVSKKSGGDTGWMEQSSTPDEIVQAGLTEKGQLSGVIKSGNSYLVVRLDDIKPAQIKPLADMQKELLSKLKRDKALDLYYAQQQKLNDAAANDNESLETAEAAVGIKAQITGWFSRDDVPAALNFPQLTQTIFGGSLYDGKGQALGNSDVINVEGDRTFVLRIAGYQGAETKPFSAVKDEVAAMVKRNKAETQAKIEGEKLLAALQAGKGDEALKEANLTFSDKQTLTRQSEDRLLVNAVFALPHPTQDKPVYGVSQDNKDNVVLIALDAVAPGKLKDDEKQKFLDEVLKGNSGIIFDSLMTNLRKEADIKMGNVVEQGR